MTMIDLPWRRLTSWWHCGQCNCSVLADLPTEPSFSTMICCCCYFALPLLLLLSCFLWVVVELEGFLRYGYCCLIDIFWWLALPRIAGLFVAVAMEDDSSSFALLYWTETYDLA